MSDARRTKADLIAELDSLRARVADLSATADAAASTRKALQKIETRYRHALQNARAAIAEIDEKGVLTYVSPTLTQILGYLPEEVLNRPGFEWVHDDDRREIEELYRQHLVSDGNARIVYRARHKAGRWVWLETTGTAHRASDGSSYTIAFTRDITELRRADETLREREARYRQLAENASDLIAEIDARGRLLFIGPNCSAMLGYDPKDLIGKTLEASGLAAAVHPEDLGSVREAFESSLTSRTAGSFACRVRHLDRSWRWLECSARGYSNGDGAPRSVVIARDVTHRVRAELELRESEERFRVLAEASNDVVFELDAEGRIVYRSPNSIAVLGESSDQVVGTAAFTRLHPDDVERAISLFLEHLKTPGPLPSEVLRARHQDGSYRLIEYSGVNYKTADGEVRIVVVGRDVTEAQRMQEERRGLEQRMQQIQKMEGLGVLAGGVAHDFNNLLTPILGDATLALMELPPDSPACVRLEKIKGAAQRAASLTKQMLAYAGTESLQVERLDLSRIMREMTQLVESATSRKAVLEYDLADDLPAIEGDAAQISQVAMNMITNASEALGDRTGRIAIRTGTVDADRDYLSRAFPSDHLPEMTYVYLEITDTGQGMDAETRERVFDPFFTTKFKGRGLGLAAVLGIVRGHGGAIEIESEAGRGARFRALFPACGRPPARRAPVAPPAEEWSGSGTVLVADDDLDVLELAAETLGRAGLKVIRAADGAEAVEAFRRHADEIEAVFLDRTMPLKSGEEAFDEIRRIRPDARIVLFSGYLEASVRERFADRDLAGFLHKPFLPAALLRKAREALEK